MRLDLTYYGNPILRKKALPVEEITDEIRELVSNMVDTMYETKGLGLAAPQVGVSLAIYVSCIEKEDDEGEIHCGEPQIFINPVLSNPSDVLVEREEGCLSIPGIYGGVVRPLSIDVEATDQEGNQFKITTTRYVARCMMHEYDHLQGILFPDRIKGKRRKEMEPELNKIKMQYRK